MITYKNKECGNGYVLRKGYTRKYHSNVKRNGFTVRRKGTLYTVYPKANVIKIPEACVKKPPSDKNKSAHDDISLRKGDLIKYGYQYRLSDKSRHVALRKAIKKHGALHIFTKLNTISQLSKSTAPDASNILRKDANWIKNNYRLARI
jgi:hypothetical protein